MPPTVILLEGTTADKNRLALSQSTMDWMWSTVSTKIGSSSN